MRTWMVLGATMLVGVGSPGADRVLPLPLYAAEQAADEAARVLADMRAALGGARVEQVKTLSLEGPFRREAGQRQIEGTVVLTLQGPDRMHKSEDTEFPGGMSVERIVAVADGASWEDTQNRGGMGGGRMMMLRGPDGRQVDEAAMEKMRTARLTAEMQRWMLALLAAPAGEVSYAGVAESPDGTADTLDMKDARGQAVRLFVDQQTHLPLMLTFSEIRPRMMIQGGPGGPGGPGNRRDRGRGPGPGAPGGAAATPDGEPGARPTPEQIRERMRNMPPPAPSTVRLTFADYRAVDGVRVPRQIAMAVDGTPVEEWTVEKVKVDPALKADFFVKK